MQNIKTSRPTTPNQPSVLVIGGGASGMMAAIVAARNGAQVTLLEKNNTLGRKLRITGGGRCNIYNAEPNTRLLLANYGKAEQSLYSAFTAFGPSESKAFFDDLNLPTKVEARQRAFPTTEKADDVADSMAKELRRLGVEIQMRTNITGVKIVNGMITEVQSTTTSYSADTVVLATGGISKPETGSTGDGFNWLQSAGHTISEPTPTITPLKSPTKWLHSMSGKSLEGISIAFCLDGVRQFSLRGTVLCTHFGLSGPLILNNAHKVADLLSSGDVTATIDCFPDKNHKELDAIVQEVLQANPSKLVKNVLKAIVPNGMHTTIQSMLADVNFDVKTSEFPKASRKMLVHALKELPIVIDGLMGFEKAVVADGGLAINELDMRTMQSTIISNLYVTGDLLNIRRPSGGYSLQLCWTTGYLAGSNAAA